MPRAKKYPDELMDRGVRLVFESGRPIAHVAHNLGIHGWTVDEVLRKARDGLIKHHAYDLHLDAGGSESLPASEEPFIYRDRAYYLVTVLRGSDQ